MVGACLEAERDLPPVACDESKLAILSALSEEALPRRGRTRCEVRRGDVVNPPTEQIVCLVPEGGLDPIADRHVAVLVIGHQDERARILIRQLVIADPG